MKDDYNAPRVKILKVEQEKLICISGEREDYDYEEW